MPKSARILVAVDGSSHALRAVEYVARFSPSSSFVNLLTILPAGPEQYFWQLNMGEDFIDEMKKRYDRWEGEQKRTNLVWLEAARNVLMRAGFGKRRVRITLREWRLGTARDIIDEASKGYDALVMGRRGLNRMDSLLLGSVSNKIIEQVQDLPVWLVGGDIQSRKVLVAVDGSAGCRKAVETVASLLAQLDTEVTLYHMVRGLEPGLGPGFPEIEGGWEKRLEDQVREKIWEMFCGYRDCLENAGLRPRGVGMLCKVGGYSRAEGIVNEARKGGHGTIIMGRRGMSKVREFVMGRVTNKVLDRAEGLAVWIVP